MRIVVVGGGIAGLAAARFARETIGGAQVLVCEGSPSPGGKLRLGEVGGHTVDLGAESVLARRAEGLELIAAAGGEIVHPASVEAGIWTHGAVRPLPPTVLGIPADPEALAASGIVRGRLLSRDLPPPAADVAVGPYVRARLGDEVVDRLVEPLLGGIYAGRAETLSLRAAGGQIADLGRDLVAGAAVRRAATQAGPVFAGIAGGVGRLPGLLAADLEVRTACTVRELRRERDLWRLAAGPVGEIETFSADAVVLAVPPPSAARLLADIAPRAAFELAGIALASVAIVTFALPADGFPAPLELSGFLVPPVDGTAIKGATYSSVKWPWLAEAVGEDVVIVRCSVGRMGETAVLHAPDGVVAELALSDLRAATGFAGEAIDVHVQRWGGALPQYEVGHLDRVARIEGELEGVRGIEVCGAAYRGLGIPAVIAGAARAVARLRADS